LGESFRSGEMGTDKCINQSVDGRGIGVGKFSKAINLSGLPVGCKGGPFISPCVLEVDLGCLYSSKERSTSTSHKYGSKRNLRV